MASEIKRGKFVEVSLTMLAAAWEARLLGHKKIIAIEFGVFKGKGFKHMHVISKYIARSPLKTKFEIYGFDLGGMPPMGDYRDHNDLWHEGDLAGNLDSLKSWLPDNCKLIIGDVRDTVKPFIEEKLGKGVVLGFVSIDIDLYTSTLAALNIFDSDPSNYLPVVPMYCDDVYGSFLYNPWCGEQLAINEFNTSHEHCKIHHYGGAYKKVYMSQILNHPHRTERRTKHPLLQFLFKYCGL